MVVKYAGLLSENGPGAVGSGVSVAAGGDNTSSAILTGSAIEGFSCIFRQHRNSIRPVGFKAVCRFLNANTGLSKNITPNREVIMSNLLSPSLALAASLCIN